MARRMVIHRLVEISRAARHGASTVDCSLATAPHPQTALHSFDLNVESVMRLTLVNYKRGSELNR